MAALFLCHDSLLRLCFIQVSSCTSGLVHYSARFRLDIVPYCQMCGVSKSLCQRKKEDYSLSTGLKTRFLLFLGNYLQMHFFWKMKDLIRRINFYFYNQSIFVLNWFSIFGCEFSKLLTLFQLLRLCHVIYCHGDKGILA